MSGHQPQNLSVIDPNRFPLASRRCDERRMARPFEQPRLASPRSISLLAPDRPARHEREIPMSCHRWRVAVRERVRFHQGDETVYLRLRRE